MWEVYGNSNSSQTKLYDAEMGYLIKYTRWIQHCGKSISHYENEKLLIFPIKLEQLLISDLYNFTVKEKGRYFEECPRCTFFVINYIVCGDTRSLKFIKHNRRLVHP